MSCNTNGRFRGERYRPQAEKESAAYRKSKEAISEASPVSGGAFGAALNHLRTRPPESVGSVILCFLWSNPSFLSKTGYRESEVASVLSNRFGSTQEAIRQCGKKVRSEANRWPTAVAKHFK